MASTSPISMFQGASNFTVHGNISTNNIAGDNQDHSHSTVTNNYGSRQVSHTHYDYSRNDYSTHQPYYNNGPQTTVHNVNSHNTNQTSYTNSNNDNSNTAYGPNAGLGGGGGFRGPYWPSDPAQFPPTQGWPRGSPHDQYQGDPGFQQYGYNYDPQTDGGSYAHYPPDHSGNYQQAYLDAQAPPQPSTRRHRKGKSANELEQPYQIEIQPPQHEAAKRISFHSVTAPHPNNPFIALQQAQAQQQQYADAMQFSAQVENSVRISGAQIAQAQSTPSGRQRSSPSPPRPSASQTQVDSKDAQSASADPNVDKGDKGTKKENKKAKGKKPQRATVESTDDEDDYLHSRPQPKKRGTDEREIDVQATLGPVLESNSLTDDGDDDWDDWLSKKPPVMIPQPASESVLSKPAPRAATGTGIKAANTAAAAASAAPTTGTAQASSQAASADARPVVPAHTASAPLPQQVVSNAVAINSATVADLTSAHTAAARPVSTASASISTSGGRTAEDKRLAHEAIDLERIASSLEDGLDVDGKKKKKKKKFTAKLSEVFGKKNKPEGGVVGIAIE